MSNTDRWIIPFIVDLENGAPLRHRPPQGIMLPGDSQAHTIQVTAYAGREPAALTGTPRGYFIREADGATVICAGSRSGNVARVTMAQACYAYPGPLRCVIRLENSGAPDVTLVDTTFYVESGTGENIIDPGTPIHNVAELLEHLEDMETATANAKDAVSCIAQAYSASAIYTEGEYAIHDGKLYRCTTMASAETWTPAHWTQVNFGAELYGMDTSMHHHDLVFPRNSGRIAVTSATSGAITVTVPRDLVRVRDRAAVNIDLGAADNAYTVPDGSALILTGDNALAVGTLDAASLDNNGSCVLLFNDRGVPCGQWGGADKAEMSTLKSAVSTVKSKIGDFIIENSINLFSSFNAILGKRIRTSTNQIIDSAEAYISDYIPVSPDTEYTVGISLGSTNYYTVAFYDSNKEFISGEAFSGTTDKRNCVSPATAAFAIVSGAIETINDQYFCLSTYIFPANYKPSLDVLTTDARLISPIGRLINGENAIINASGRTIYLLSPDGIIRNYGASIPVTGTGSYVYWNKMTNAFFRGSVNYVPNQGEYLVAVFDEQSFSGRDITSFLSNEPFWEIDQINKKINVSLKNAAIAYYSSRGHISIAPVTTSLDIPASGNCILVYNLVNSQFEITSSYANIQPGATLVIAAIHRMNIVSSTPIITFIGDKSNAQKKCVCYGDSLTWYDGQKFTWGPYEGETCIGFESYLSTYLFMSVTNRGRSGKTTPEICGYIRNK